MNVFILNCTHQNMLKIRRKEQSNLSANLLSHQSPAENVAEKTGELECPLVMFSEYGGAY